MGQQFIALDADVTIQSESRRTLHSRIPSTAFCIVTTKYPCSNVRTLHYLTVTHPYHPSRPSNHNPTNENNSTDERTTIINNTGPDSSCTQTVVRRNGVRSRSALLKNQRKSCPRMLHQFQPRFPDRPNNIPNAFLHGLFHPHTVLVVYSGGGACHDGKVPL